jgi:transposase-like protein
MAKQGQHFSESELQRMVALLASSDMTIGQIAQRMECSRSAIVAVNRRYRVREYGSRRSTWKTNGLVETSNKPH